MFHHINCIIDTSIYLLGYPAAQYNLGYCYEKGLGVPKKLHDMIQWYRLAKDNGVTKAAEALQRYWKDYSDPDFL